MKINIKLNSLYLILLILAFSSNFYVAAEEDISQSVGENRNIISPLAVYSQPTTESQIVEVIPEGHQFIQVLSAESDFCLVQYDINGNTGYVLRDELRIISGDYGVIRSQSNPLPLVEQPSGFAAIITSILPGSIVPIISADEFDNFIKVVYGNQVGYLSVLYFESIATYEEKLTVRANLHSEQLQLLIKQHIGSQWNHTFAGAIECKGFATLIFTELFGMGERPVGIGSFPYNPTNYILNNLDEAVDKLGTIVYFSAEEAKNLLSQARVGDFIQARTNGGNPHSMIVVSVHPEEGYIVLFDCNLDGKNTVAIYEQTFVSFADFYVGASLYSFKDY